MRCYGNSWLCDCGSRTFATLPPMRNWTMHRGKSVCVSCGAHGKWPSPENFDHAPMAMGDDVARLLEVVDARNGMGPRVPREQGRLL